MSLEDWKAIFEIGGVVLLFLTFLFGAGALLTSTRINARQAVQLREFEKRLTDAKTELGHQQERAANAERALLELQTRLAHRRISQSDHDRFVASLQPYKGSVVDLTEITDLEAAQFAKDIIAVLRDAGWKVNVGTMSLGAPRYKVECFLTGASEQGEALAAVLRNLPTVRIIPGPHPPHPATMGVPHIASIFVGKMLCICRKNALRPTMKPVFCCVTTSP